MFNLFKKIPTQAEPESKKMETAFLKLVREVAEERDISTNEVQKYLFIAYKTFDAFVREAGYEIEKTRGENRFKECIAFKDVLPYCETLTTQYKAYVNNKDFNKKVAVDFDTTITDEQNEDRLWIYGKTKELVFDSINMKILPESKLVRDAFEVISIYSKKAYSKKTIGFY